MSRERQRPAYDAKCYQLAEHFLDDYDLTREQLAAAADSLAARIQSTVEEHLHLELDAFGFPTRPPKVERNAKKVGFPAP